MKKSRSTPALVTQRNAASPIQRKADGAALAGPALGAPAPLAASAGAPEPAARAPEHQLGGVPISRPAGPGRPLPDRLRSQMEASFGHEFSDVRLHEDGSAQAIGAGAYTRGSDIHFAPGQYQPHTAAGQALLGHELTHVVQQRGNRVAAPRDGLAPINRDAHLEAEADTQGARAARGEAATVAGVGSGVQRKASTGGGGVIQCHSDGSSSRANEELRTKGLGKAAAVYDGLADKVNAKPHGGGKKNDDSHQTRNASVINNVKQKYIEQNDLSGAAFSSSVMRSAQTAKAKDAEAAEKRSAKQASRKASVEDAAREHWGYSPDEWAALTAKERADNIKLYKKAGD